MNKYTYEIKGSVKADDLNKALELLRADMERNMQFHLEALAANWGKNTSNEMSTVNGEKV